MNSQSLQLGKQIQWVVCFKDLKCSLQFFISGFFIDGFERLRMVHETLGGLVLLSSVDIWETDVATDWNLCSQRLIALDKRMAGNW